MCWLSITNMALKVQTLIRVVDVLKNCYLMGVVWGWGGQKLLPCKISIL